MATHKEGALQEQAAKHAHIRRETALDDAFQRGDMGRLRELLGNPPDFPNQRPSGPISIADRVLEYAIYHSPLPFIRELLKLGADPNYPDHAGFPSLIAALSTERDDKHEILEMLLARSADTEERGVNGFTALHLAATRDDLKAIELLLAHGADPNARTGVDDYTTPLEEAEAAGRTRAADLLRRHTAR